MTVGIRLQKAIIARLDAVVLRTPYATRTALAREALLIGLKKLEIKRR